MTIEEVLAKYPGAETFKFGDGEALCEKLLGLVRSGAKTATCGALRDFGEGGEPRPVPGRIDIALHWDGRPGAAIRTVEVTERRFDEVPEDFAVAEGEGTFDDWKLGHERFFRRNGGFSPDMMLLCERFEVVEVFA